MTVRSLVLFIHVVGVFGLFIGLALESMHHAAARRIAGLSLGVVLLSGMALAARIGVFGNAWVRVSFAALVLIAVAGALGRRMPSFSLSFRVAMGLAVVYLMIAKPLLEVSLIVLGVALAVAIVLTTALSSRPRTVHP